MEGERAKETRKRAQSHVEKGLALYASVGDIVGGGGFFKQFGKLRTKLLYFCYMILLLGMGCMRGFFENCWETLLPNF